MHSRLVVILLSGAYFIDGGGVNIQGTLNLINATIVLAGLLETQREQVVAAFAACGCRLEEVDRRGDWTILRLQAGETRYVPVTPPDPKGRDGWALDI